MKETNLSIAVIVSALMKDQQVLTGSSECGTEELEVTIGREKMWANQINVIIA